MNKKKWLAVLGSPRKNGNTEALVDKVIDRLDAMDIYVEKVQLSHESIQTCNACEYCIKAGVCCIEDSLGPILEKMKSYDGVILASPSYNYNMTAQMKALLDRSFSLNDYTGGWSSRVPPGKKAIVLGTCMGKTEDFMGYTIKGMSICLKDLGYKIILELPYLNTKERQVSQDEAVDLYLEEQISRDSLWT